MKWQKNGCRETLELERNVSSTFIKRYPVSTEHEIFQSDNYSIFRSDNSKQKPFPSFSRTLYFYPRFSWTTRIFKPIFPLGGSRNSLLYFYTFKSSFIRSPHSEPTQFCLSKNSYRIISLFCLQVHLSSEDLPIFYFLHNLLTWSVPISILRKMIFVLFCKTELKDLSLFWLGHFRSQRHEILASETSAWKSTDLQKLQSTIRHVEFCFSSGIPDIVNILPPVLYC